MKYKIENFPEVKGSSLEEVIKEMKELTIETAEHQFSFISDGGFNIVHEDGSELSIPERIELIRLYQEEVIKSL